VLHNREWKNGLTRTMQNWPFIAYLVAIGIAINTGLLIGLLISFNKSESLAWALSAGALIGGPLFSVLELHGSHKPMKGE
jgi:hypothetical protein